jgi:hypothetical protein
MSRTEKKILGKNAAKIIKVPKSAYCDELRIFHYFWYNLATTILADEVKDEQHTEDTLKPLEVK